jgi:hypothetical protein|tara:strand:- start:7857 stop:8315 length:459 start_codon:yes stop_codon:yes gene_type:complete
MDRNSILTSLTTSYSSYSSSDSRSTVEKVLKFSGGNIDIRKRADIKREVVIFRLLSGSAVDRVEDEKPLDLVQLFETNVYVEQADTHSGSEVAYDRMLELTDQLIDWANATSGNSINSDVETLSTTGVDTIDEEDGYLSTNVNFECIIKIRQ